MEKTFTSIVSYSQNIRMVVCQILLRLCTLIALFFLLLCYFSLAIYLLLR
jgi:hypothetical protein